jgi:hypothetical protein
MQWPEERSHNMSKSRGEFPHSSNAQLMLIAGVSLSQRLDRRKQNHEDAKAKRAKAEVLWKQIDEES